MRALRAAFLRQVAAERAAFGVTLDDWPRLERIMAAHAGPLLEMGCTAAEAEQYLWDTWRSLHCSDVWPELPRGLWWRCVRRDLAAAWRGRFGGRKEEA